MRLRLTLVVAAVAIMCLGAVAVAAVSLEKFTARPGEETGFTPRGKPHVFQTARAWLVSGGEKGSTLNTDAGRLTREGFVVAVVQHMAYQLAPNNGGGISLVVELGTAKAAKAERLVQLNQDIAGEGHSATIRRFNVSGVPSARGFTVVLPGMPGSAANAVFTEGRCVLLVGDLIPNGDPKPPVQAGVEAIDHRTRGRCP